MTQPKKNLVIFDISSHFHRAFESVKSRGGREEYGAFFNNKPNYMIKKALEMVDSEFLKLKRQANVNPDYIVIVLDHAGKNFRHDLYPEYKGTRPPSDPEYNFMRDCCAKLLKLKGYYVIIKPDVEADDVIATIATKAKKTGLLNIYICSGDKDMFDLIDDSTYVFCGAENKNQGVLYDIQGCLNKKGVLPSKINDYLVMDGDRVDNVIGIPNVGPKKIPKILEHYTLSEIIEDPQLLNQDKIDIVGKKGVIKYIEENKEFIKLMQKIVTMDKNLDLKVNLKHFIKKYEDVESVNNAYKSLGLKR